jgi:hypothetical protein
MFFCHLDVLLISPAFRISVVFGSPHRASTHCQLRPQLLRCLSMFATPSASTIATASLQNAAFAFPFPCSAPSAFDSPLRFVSVPLVQSNLPSESDPLRPLPSLSVGPRPFEFCHSKRHCHASDLRRGCGGVSEGSVYDVVDGLFFFPRAPMVAIMNLSSANTAARPCLCRLHSSNDLAFEAGNRLNVRLTIAEPRARILNAQYEPTNGRELKAICSNFDYGMRSSSTSRTVQPAFRIIAFWSSVMEYAKLVSYRR